MSAGLLLRLLRCVEPGLTSSTSRLLCVVVDRNPPYPPGVFFTAGLVLHYLIIQVTSEHWAVVSGDRIIEDHMSTKTQNRSLDK